MPELPEVETIRQRLRRGNAEEPSLLGASILKADLLWQRSLDRPGVSEFHRRIAGQTILEIARRGKFLNLELRAGVLLIHLRMSGDLFLEKEETPFAPHHRVVFHLDNGWRLAFNDPRKFGRVWLVEQADEVLSGLGPEPLDPALGSADFFQMLQKCHRQLKPALLDQKFLAGLGNIYTDEALNRARLHPLTKTDEVTLQQAEKLLISIREVLQDGIRNNGASIDWVYRGGDFQNHFRVYGRKDQPCPECGTGIERIIVGQRSTYYCPFCQDNFGKFTI